MLGRADIPVVVKFPAPMSPEQQQWLYTAAVRVRRVSFHVSDAASAALLHDPLTLVSCQLQLWLYHPEH